MLDGSEDPASLVGPAALLLLIGSCGTGVRSAPLGRNRAEWGPSPSRAYKDIIIIDALLGNILCSHLGHNFFYLLDSKTKHAHDQARRHRKFWSGKDEPPGSGAQVGRISNVFF